MTTSAGTEKKSWADRAKAGLDATFEFLTRDSPGIAVSGGVAAFIAVQGAMVEWANAGNAIPGDEMGYAIALLAAPIAAAGVQVALANARKAGKFEQFVDQDRAVGVRNFNFKDVPLRPELAVHLNSALDNLEKSPKGMAQLQQMIATDSKFAFKLDQFFQNYQPSLVPDANAEATQGDGIDEGYSQPSPA